MIFSEIGYKTEEELILWAEKWGIDGHLPLKCCLHQMIYSDNIFSRSAMKGYDLEQSSLWSLVVKEVDIIKKEASYKGKAFLEKYVPACGEKLWQKKEEQLFASFCNDSTVDFLKNLTDYYHIYGFGDYAFFPFFRWQDGLYPISHPDLVEMTALIGYEDQKKQICENTEGFLRGGRGNHVLLYGQRGTGKSSTIKALGRLYFEQGLRLVELDRSSLKELPSLCRYLEDLGLYFIIYIDDLSFEDTETDYKSLKAVLEGSLAAPSENILLYATSNRRHLIRETWQQRQDEEIHGRETEDEILSLSHRFGLSVSFFSPEREAFLAMVEDIAKRRNIHIDKEDLRREAILWTRWQQGLSGRTAVQFVNALEIREKRLER